MTQRPRPRQGYEDVLGRRARLNVGAATGVSDLLVLRERSVLRARILAGEFDDTKLWGQSAIEPGATDNVGLSKSKNKTGAARSP